MGKPSETDSIKSQISSKTSRWKRTAQKDAVKGITSDSQVNSYFPYRVSQASQTISIYFYLFLYLYISRITINNGTPHLKSLTNRRAALPMHFPRGFFNIILNFLQESKRTQCRIYVIPAIATMHGSHSVFDIGHCTVIHCDAGGLSLIDQRGAGKS